MPEFNDFNGNPVKVEAHSEVLRGFEEAVKAIWDPPATHAEKVALFKKLEAIYFRATGWHLTGTATPEAPPLSLYGLRAGLGVDEEMPATVPYMGISRTDLPAHGKFLPADVESLKERP